MALVPITHVYDTLSIINNTGLLDGQILYTTDQTVNKIFADVKVNNILRRIEIGGTNTIDTVLDQNSGHAIANSAVAKLAQTVHTNLLNPTLQTTTVGEVTCTSNGDGTYTFNGTTTTSKNFFPLPIGQGYEMKSGVTYHLSGCPKGGSSTTYELIAEAELGTAYKKQYAHDYGNGVSFTVPQEDIDAGYRLRITMSIKSNVTNLTFKPMLTTDLSATYNDYVPYSGDGELNANVADLYKNLNTTNSNLTALDTKVGAQSLLPTPSQSVTQNINTLKAEINRLNSNLTTQYTTTPIIVGKWGNYNVKRVSFSGSLTFGGGVGRHSAIADLSSVLTRNTRPISVKGFYNYTDTVSREQIIAIGSTNMSANGLVTDASLLRSIDSNSGYILNFTTYTSDSISQTTGHYDVTIEYVDMN